MVVIGIKNVQYKNKENGQDVHGVRLHLMYPITKDGEGYAVDTIYLSEWFINNRLNGMVPKLNEDIEPCYNKQGRLSDIRFVALTPQK